MCFRSLPVELLLKILEITDPEDLPSMIFASRPLFQTFLAFRAKILTASLENAMEPEALQPALALAHFESNQSFEELAGAGELDAYGNPKRRTFTMPSDVSSLISMCRTHKQVAVFVRGFAEFSTRNLQETIRAANSREGQDVQAEHIDPVCQKFDLPLSQKERTRFQRAFYRLELYSRLNPSNPNCSGVDYPCYRPPRPPAYALASLDTLSKYSLIATPVQEWEVAEMLCAHHYLRRIALGYFFEIRDQFIDAVLESPGVEHFPYPHGVDKGGYIILRDYLGSPKLKLDWDNIKRGWLDYLALKGLEFMTQLATANPDKRRNLILAHALHYRDLGMEISAYRSDDNLPPEKVTPEMEGIEPSEDGRVSGTLGFRIFPLDLDFDLRHGNEIMWETAFPFRDAEKIRSVFVTKALDENISSSRSFHTQDWWEGKYVESAWYRLKCIALRKDELEEISQKFVPQPGP